MKLGKANSRKQFSQELRCKLQQIYADLQALRVRQEHVWRMERIEKPVKEVFDKLRRFESRNITYVEPDGSWPIIWRRAKGVHVWDERGKKYLDLTAAFGVAATGHANSSVVRAGQGQMAQLLHAMGDVHPHALKAELAEQLSKLTFHRWSYEYNKLNWKFHAGGWSESGKTIFCNSGFEAVEAALKTAFLATKRCHVIAFQGAYHGLGYGALTTTHRDYFRSPFRPQLADFADFVPFPKDDNDLNRVEKALNRVCRQRSVGAVIVEPIQVRGGIKIHPIRFLPMLRRWCDAHGIVLIYDEIYTGFGRTGAWFACEHIGAPPDIICLGKALTGGFPLSACVGHADLMDAAWPPASGEAIHTSTFLGHPVGCAMALAQIKVLRHGTNRCRDLFGNATLTGHALLKALKRVPAPKGYRLVARGLGLIAGLEICRADGTPATQLVHKIVKEMLHRGYILFPEGENSNVIGFSPPLIITRRQLGNTVAALKKVIADCAKALA
jgi:4-aminobutyrate aminotransferase-like enzyme